MAGRGRPRKVVGGPATASNPAPKDHNAMSDDQEQALTRQHAAKRQLLLDAEKSAKANRMNFDKVIKSDLGPDGLNNIKLLAQFESEKGEEDGKAEIERRAKVARWAGLQIGTQGSLFEEDRRSMNEKAFAEGKRVGLKGGDPVSPYAGEAGQKFLEGWHDGQAVNLSGIKKKKPEAEIVTSATDKKNTGPDEFDAAASAGVPDAETKTETGEPWPDDAQVGSTAGGTL